LHPVFFVPLACMDGGTDVTGPLSVYPTLAEVKGQIIPQASRLLPRIPFTARSNVLLLAIGLQESRFTHRRQIKGPARGFWQFEAGGGTKGVLTHPGTRVVANQLVRKQLKGRAYSYPRVNEFLAYSDVLACAFARLLLWSDPAPLPALGDGEGAWQYYLRNWRPGKPHRETWDGLYRRALDAVAAS